jgi:hypothetical protein
MPLIEIYHRSAEGWSRYEPSRSGFEKVTGPADYIEDAPKPGYYLLAGRLYPFAVPLAGPFASLDAAKGRLDIEMRYRDAVEKYEAARDAARVALYEVAAVLTGDETPNHTKARVLVQQLDEECDGPCVLPRVFETASDYLDQD